MCSFLLVDEDKITLREVTQLFKKENANWEPTKTTFADKDMKDPKDVSKGNYCG